MNIHYLSGSRADFGLMLPCLDALRNAPDFECSVVATGQHLQAKYGMTIADIEASGLPIVARIPVDLTGASGSEMALAMAAELAGLTRTWTDNRPDAIMVLGDRGEMVAGALAAIQLGIPTIHVSGGERSGTIDESFRHAITKLAHVHLCSTEQSRDRIVRMGELERFTFVIGAPGLVGLSDQVDRDFDYFQRFGFGDDKPISLVVFHPVVQEAGEAASQIEALLAALRKAGYRQLILKPNSDAGGKQIDSVLESCDRTGDVCVVTHLDRRSYLGAVTKADLMIGNSSSGIIESASLGTPCVNVGTRQNARERNSNTIDCPDFDVDSLLAAIGQAESLIAPFRNVHGDGSADLKMLEALRSVDFGADLLNKSNSF